MFAALLATINSLLYTTLAFLLPLFFTAKCLLRQYTVTIVAPTSFASASVDNATGEDESEVPSSFIETSSNGFKSSITSIVSPSSTVASVNSSSWLYYWAISALVHCVAGVYELLILPFVGNSLLYYSAKYVGLYWLTKDEAKASRSLWTAIIAPFAVKYEKDADLFVQAVKEQGKIAFAKSVASLRQLRSKTIKTQ
jgi:hypothetical protein